MNKKTVCYNGFLGGPRSMGRVGHFFLTHLMRNPRYRVCFQPFKTDYMAPHWDQAFRDLIVDNPADFEIDQFVTFCSVLDAQRPRYAHQMTPWLFYELNSLPLEIVRRINSNDHVYADSSFVRRVFLDSGVNVPVNVMGHGFDPSHFRFTPRSLNGKFTFLCVAENTPRKNLPTLIRCFEKAFQGNNEVRLVLKLGLHGAGNIRQFITQPEKVLLFTRSIEDEAEMAQLYQAAHAFVLPTRSEGFGMPILEAMATGLPVIVTNYSGHLDFCNDTNAYLIHNRGMVDSDPGCFPYINSQWAEPDQEHLVHLMQHVYQNYERALSVGLAAHRAVSSEWTWGKQLDRCFG